MADLTIDMEAYEKLRADLEASHMGEWVVVHDGQLIGTYPTFDAAAREAVHHFGAGPYLIRQVGASKLILPHSNV